MTKKLATSAYLFFYNFTAFTKIYKYFYNCIIYYERRFNIFISSKFNHCWISLLPLSFKKLQLLYLLADVIFNILTLYNITRLYRILKLLILVRLLTPKFINIKRLQYLLPVGGVFVSNKRSFKIYTVRHIHCQQVADSIILFLVLLTVWCHCDNVSRTSVSGAKRHYSCSHKVLTTCRPTIYEMRDYRRLQKLIC